MQYNTTHVISPLAMTTFHGLVLEQMDFHTQIPNNHCCCLAKIIGSSLE
jgi:hypothetical protein